MRQRCRNGARSPRADAGARLVGARSVAGKAVARGWGPGGRRFKSCLPDPKKARSDGSFGVDEGRARSDPGSNLPIRARARQVIRPRRRGLGLVVAGKSPSRRWSLADRRGQLWRVRSGPSLFVSAPARSLHRTLRRSLARASAKGADLGTGEEPPTPSAHSAGPSAHASALRSRAEFGAAPSSARG
jgi:hypothetical protein